MKKWMVWLTVIVMLVSMTACGKGPSDPSKNPDGAPAVDGTKVETPLWTLVYDEAVWTLAQEDMTTDEDYCRADLKVADPDDEDGYLVYVTIEADIGDPYDFRDDLAYYGFDAYEYAENNAYPFETVGGVDCLTYTDDGAMVVSGFNWNRTGMIYVVGKVSDHTLAIGGQEISLRDLCGRGADVRFTISKSLF